MSNWFAVDKVGLGKQAEQQSKGRLIGELVQNALDEAGVTTIKITLNKLPARPYADLTVEDDSPEGFKDLSHAYTLFANSYKRDNPEQRGQYNFGEKLVLSICEEASISTTTGTVEFDSVKGRIDRPRLKRESGSVFSGRIKMTNPDFLEVSAYLQSLLLPENVVVTFNGDRLLPRMPLKSFEAPLETLVADETGVMRPRTRKAVISVYEPLEGETASLYEMGLPIVETGDKWHVSVNQKVPLNRDRDNVKPAYLQSIRVLVLNAMSDKLSDEDGTAGWCKLAGSDARCSDEAIKTLVKLRFGDKVAAPDPSDVEAMKAFQAQGGTIVAGLSKGEWANVKRSGAVLPAGKICPTAKPYSLDPNADPVNVVSEDKWTDSMKNIVSYARYLAKELMDVQLQVTVVHTTNNFVACYGNGNLDFNLLRLGHKWFELGVREDVDRLLIHEFGHQYSMDHLSEDYYDALCLLGAKLKKVALEKPEELKRFA